MPFQRNCIACNSKLPNPIISNAGILCNVCRNQSLFRKRIIVTGITRMRGDHVCVSGLDPDTWHFIRPVFSEGRLTRDFVIEGRTQTFMLFDLVEMEFRAYKPSPVFHTEDWVVNRNFAPRLIRHLTNQEIVEAINRVAIDNLRSAFEQQNKSIFVVKTRSIFKILCDHYEKFKVRISFVDWSGNIFERIPVVDLLLLAKAQHMVARRAINWQQQIMNMFNNNPFRYLRIGTTRQFKGEYWKQISAIITIPDIFAGESYSDFQRKNGVDI